MNKLLILLFSFLLSRLAMVFIGSFTEGALASPVGCGLYILLFLLFSPKEGIKKAHIGFGQSIFIVISFLLISLGVSSIVGIFQAPDKRELSVLYGVIVVLFVPLAEELFFRATLFATLNSLTTPMVSVMVSSLIFSMAHTGVASMIVAFILGILLTCIYKRTGGIRIPFICHALNNLLAFLF